ncbi:THAP domain-containing protein 2-like [Pecten maximus]|uniref:THAP domain-containing protein 2-like n=1 Tax=Pecten maximus TaxID=6579 RepID=UPI001458B9C8|nr:THAP domain-containing protein 2-like [Pecten maximus]XP_033753038.1 THAP domain-containing protein 2-like [Pecten maximus]
MVQCAAYNGTVKSGQGLSLYIFPKDKTLRKIWTGKLRRQEFSPSQHSKLCERHFEDDQFAVNPIVLKSLSWTLKRKKLVPNAVPTIFDYKRKIVEAKRKSTFQAKTTTDRDYVEELFEDPILRRELNNTFTQARAACNMQNKERPSPLSKSCTHERKEDIVHRHKSRFNGL